MSPVKPLAEFGITGKVRNLRAVLGDEPFSAVVSFDLEEVMESEYSVAIYLDGELVRILPEGVYETTVTGLFESRGRIDAVVFPNWEQPPDMHGHFGADSAYIVWPSIDSNDIAAIKVMHSTALDGQFLASPTVLDTLTQRVIETKIQALPDNGALHGRISVSGSLPADFTGNGLMTLTVGPGGTVEWNGFGYTGSGDIDKGLPVPLPLGIEVIFEDDAEAYVEGDVYTIRVGISSSYQTGPLPEGVHYFGRQAINAAGNTSGIQVLATAGVEIEYEPGAVVDAAIGYDEGANGMIYLTWTDPGDADLTGIAIYSNYHPATHSLMDYVDEDTPLAVVAPGVQHYEIENGATIPAGTLKVFIRPRDAHTNESTSMEMVQLALPPTALELGLNLGNILLLEAQPAPAGDILLSWHYFFQTPDNATGFAYWLSEEMPDFTAPPTDVLSAESSAWPLAFFSQTIPGGPTGTTYYIGMKATDGNDHYGAASAIVSVTVNADGPVVTGIAKAVSN